jgi:Na+/H+-dicarboxylate symporter
LKRFAGNEILQIVVFSIFWVACAAMGDYSKPIVKVLDIFSHVILRVVGYMMSFPWAFWRIISKYIATDGLGVFVFYRNYFFSFVLGILLLWILLLAVGYLILRNRLPELCRRIGQPLLIAFSTTSSEAVFPKIDKGIGGIWLQ